MKTRYTVVGGEIIAQKSSGVRAEYVPDALGSTVTLAQNAPPASYTPLSYYPYGTVANEGPDSPVTPLKFAGTHGYYSDASGLIYVQGRYLSTNQGRFIGAVGGRQSSWNAYLYASGNPTTAVVMQAGQPPAVPVPIPPVPDPPTGGPDKPCAGKTKTGGPGVSPNPPIPPPNKRLKYPIHNPPYPLIGPSSHFDNHNPLNDLEPYNCFQYACDYSGSRVPDKYDPNKNFDCKSLIAAALTLTVEKSGIYKSIPVLINACIDGTCPPGYHPVRAYISTNFEGRHFADFHWTRCDAGQWSEKHGDYPVNNISGDDPDSYELTKYNYTRCDGDYCSPNLIDTKGEG